MDDIFDENEDELTLISKEWNNIAATRKKEGYKDGMDRGQKVTIQDGFDQGFKEGFSCSILVSKIKGIINGLMEFRSLYEGNPINDIIAHEAQMVLDSIEQLETDQVISEMMGMKVTTSKDGCCGGGQGGCDEDDMMDGIQQLNCTTSSTQHQSSKCGGGQEGCCGDINGNITTTTKPRISRMQQNLTPYEMEQLIQSTSQVKDILSQCQKVLDKLGWKDDLANLLNSN